MRTTLTLAGPAYELENMGDGWGSTNEAQRAADKVNGAGLDYLVEQPDVYSAWVDGPNIIVMVNSGVTSDQLGLDSLKVIMEEAYLRACKLD